MDIEERMFRQQQRDRKNPYKEGSRSWIAWARGYAACEVDGFLKVWKQHQSSSDIGDVSK